MALNKCYFMKDTPHPPDAKALVEARKQEARDLKMWEKGNSIAQNLGHHDDWWGGMYAYNGANFHIHRCLAGQRSVKIDWVGAKTQSNRDGTVFHGEMTIKGVDVWQFNPAGDWLKAFEELYEQSLLATEEKKRQQATKKQLEVEKGLREKWGIDLAAQGGVTQE